MISSINDILAKHGYAFKGTWEQLESNILAFLEAKIEELVMFSLEPIDELFDATVTKSFDNVIDGLKDNTFYKNIGVEYLDGVVNLLGTFVDGFSLTPYSSTYEVQLHSATEAVLLFHKQTTDKWYYLHYKPENDSSSIGCIVGNRDQIIDTFTKQAKVLGLNEQIELEYDEMWSFVHDKNNPQWLWTAISRKTKQVIAYHIGKRSNASFEELYKKVPQDYKQCKSTSDFWHSYYLLPKHLHKMVGKETGETAQAEAINNKIRQRIGRYARKTCSFSKSLGNHKHITGLFFQNHNLEILSVK